MAHDTSDDRPELPPPSVQPAVRDCPYCGAEAVEVEQIESDRRGFVSYLCNCCSRVWRVRL